MIYCDNAVIGVILPMDIIRVIIVVFVTVVPLVLVIVNSLVVVRQIGPTVSAQYISACCAMSAYCAI